MLKVCGGFEITDAESFENVMCNLQQDAQNLIEAGQRAGAFVAGLSGATDKILKGISL